MTIYVGAKAIETIEILVKTGQSGRDLTTVLAGRFRVYCEGVAPVTWEAVLSAQTTDELTMSYEFNANGLDVAVADLYVLVPQLDFVGGSINARAVLVTVVDPADL